MKSTKIIAPLIVALSLTLVSCGKQDISPIAPTTQVPPATEINETSTTALQETVGVEKSATPIGADSPDQAVKAYMNSMRECNYSEAYSYIQGGPEKLTQLREELKSNRELIGTTKDIAAGSNLSEDGKSAMNAVVDTAVKNTPKTAEEACEEMKNTWKDDSFSITKTDMIDTDNARVTISLTQGGKTGTETIESVRTDGKWFVIYKAISVESEADTSTSSVSDDIKSATVVEGDVTNDSATSSTQQ